MIYFFLVLLIIIGIYKYEYKNFKGGKLLYLLIYLSTCIIVGLFNPIGGDCLSYSEKFRDLSIIGEINFQELDIGGRFQPLWIFFNGIIKFIYDDYNFYLFIHTTIINGIIFYYVYKTTKYKFSVLFLFITTFQFFFFDFELQRESLAVCIGLLIFKNLINRQYLKYYIGCFIAFLFHVSAIFLFIIPILFVLFKLKSERYFFIIIILIIVAICSVGSYIQLLSLLDVTSGVVDQFEYYDDLNASFTKILAISWLSAIAPLVFIIISKKINYTNDFLVNCAYTVLILTICRPYVEIIWRINDYVVIPYFIFIIEILRAKKRMIFKQLTVIAITVIYITVIYLWTRPMDSNIGKIYYYEFFIPYRSIL